MQFLRIVEPAKILLFGNWDFLINSFIYIIFRENILFDNIIVIVTNIANFIIENNLNNIDIDWEYPKASINNTFTFIKLILIYFYLFKF